MFRRNSFARSAVTVAAFLFATGFTTSRGIADESPADPFRGEWTFYAEPDEDAVNAGQTPFNEAVLFHNGEFSAAVFAMFGFAPAPYTVNYDTGTAIFVAVLPSNDRGTLTWVGGETPTGLTGELIWNRGDGTELRYYLTGERATN